MCFISVSNTKKSVTVAIGTPSTVYHLVTLPDYPEGKKPGEGWGEDFVKEQVVVSETEIAVIVEKERLCDSKEPSARLEVRLRGGCGVTLVWKRDSAALLLFVTHKNNRGYEALREEALATAGRVKYAKAAGGSGSYG